MSGQDGKVFDGRTMDKKVPALQFKVGVGKVIKAWDHALLEMSVGEVAKLTVEPEWGYGAHLTVALTPTLLYSYFAGKKGNPPEIPPNATLVFEMELISAS
jgi:FK506-binding protein 3